MNVDGVAQSENRSETERPGLPHAIQTKRMLWDSSVQGFWSKKLVDQDGTVWARVFIGGSHNSRVPLSFSLSFSFSSSSSCQMGHLEMMQLFSLFFPCHVFLRLTEWNCCFFFFFAQNPNTSASTHTHNRPHNRLISPCRPSLCDPRSPSAALSSVCFHVKTGRRLQPRAYYSSHSILEVLLCVWPLFISASWLLGPQMVLLSRPNCRYWGWKKKPKKTPETHFTVLLMLRENQANIFFFPCGIFFFILIHSSLTQTRKSLSHCVQKEPIH